MKSLIDFESTQPFAVRFFNEALITRRLANTFLLRGKDLGTMYRMIMRLGQLLNCETMRDNPVQACGQCPPCKWLEGNRHPGLVTITNLTYLEDVDAETGKSKSKSTTMQKQIKVGQLDILLRELGLQSPGFHRIVVLAGADELPLSDDQQPAFPAPADWAEPAGKQFVLQPLDRKLFPDVLANKFLKTLEEPPKDVLFFLLTDSEEKLLETIVSRCQMIPFMSPPGINRMTVPTPVKAGLSQILSALEQKQWMTAHDMLVKLESETGNTAAQLLDQFQQVLWDDPAVEQFAFRQADQHLRQLEHAKRMLKDRVRPDAVLDYLALNWIDAFPRR